MRNITLFRSPKPRVLLKWREPAGFVRYRVHLERELDPIGWWLFTLVLPFLGGIVLAGCLFGTVIVYRNVRCGWSFNLRDTLFLALAGVFTGGVMSLVTLIQTYATAQTVALRESGISAQQGDDERVVQYSDILFYTLWQEAQGSKIFRCLALQLNDQSRGSFGLPDNISEAELTLIFAPRNVSFRSQAELEREEMSASLS